MPDENSGEVGGVQNTMTNLGASIGTALAGAVLVSALTASFFSGITNNPDVPASVSSKAEVTFEAGIPFLSDADVKAGLAKASVPQATADAIISENSASRLNALQSSLAVLAGLALMAQFFTRSIPNRQPAGLTTAAAPSA